MYFTRNKHTQLHNHLTTGRQMIKPKHGTDATHNNKHSKQQFPKIAYRKLTTISDKFIYRTAYTV